MVVADLASVDTAAETLCAHGLLPVLVWEQIKLTSYEPEGNEGGRYDTWYDIVF